MEWNSRHNSELPYPVGSTVYGDPAAGMDSTVYCGESCKYASRHGAPVAGSSDYSVKIARHLAAFNWLNILLISHKPPFVGFGPGDASNEIADWPDNWSMPGHDVHSDYRSPGTEKTRKAKD